jgi:hypothetical protein
MKKKKLMYFFIAITIHNKLPLQIIINPRMPHIYMTMDYGHSMSDELAMMTPTTKEGQITNLLIQQYGLYLYKKILMRLFRVEDYRTQKAQKALHDYDTLCIEYFNAFDIALGELLPSRVLWKQSRHDENYKVWQLRAHIPKIMAFATHYWATEWAYNERIRISERVGVRAPTPMRERSTVR